MIRDFLNPTFSRSVIMIKSAIAKLSTAAAFSAVAGAMMLAPQVASAANSNSLGHGVKCTWVVVSVVNNTTTLKQVCRKSGV